MLMVSRYARGIIAPNTLPRLFARGVLGKIFHQAEPGPLSRYKPSEYGDAWSTRVRTIDLGINMLT